MQCYRCQTALAPRSRSCGSCGQDVFAPYVRGQMTLGRRLDGCRLEEPSPKDYRAVPNLDSLPTAADLRGDCSAVEDQGQIGSCVANAIVGAFEHQLKRDGKPHKDFSRMFVYYNARKIMGNPMWDDGCTISTGMAALLAFGAPAEGTWPYRPDAFAMPPSPDAYLEAQHNVPSEYARLDGIENVKGALARRYPVVVSVSLPERAYAEAADTGVAPNPSASEIDAVRTKYGTHALLLVGYDKNAGTFTARNSWGEGWGNKGYFTLSFDTFLAVLAANTTWILGKLDTGAFSMTRPGHSTSAAAPPRVDGGVKDMAEKMRKEIRDGLKSDIEQSFKDIRERMKPRQGQ